MPEEDIVRLQWWGLYHDKPKIGTFMLRVKIPSGILTPAKLRAIGEVTNRYGRGDAELTTRQCIQLHWLELSALPDVFADLEAAGITSAGGCGDTVRNITGCPVSGPRRRRALRRDADRRRRDRRVLRQPRRGRTCRASTSTRSRAAPTAATRPRSTASRSSATINDGREGFAVQVGGGLSSVPRIARDLGVFVPKEDANEILGAVTTVWSEDLKYRMSRVKARLKFMVDDIGAEGMLERVEAKLGKTLERYELPPITVQPSAHIGVHAQKQDGLSYIGVPVQLGLFVGRPADRRRRPRRFVRRRHPPHAPAEPDRHRRSERARRRGARAARRARACRSTTNEIWANSIACTGEPHCNFSVGETKDRLRALVAHLERTFGDEIAELRLHLDGCPHACAQHWVGDLGFQATTGKDADGNRISAYDIFVRGSLGPVPEIGGSLFRRVRERGARARRRGPRARLARRPLEGESFTAFQRRLSDDELGVLAGLAPAKKRVREEVAA